MTGLSWRRQIDSIIGLADLDRDGRNWQASTDEWNLALRIAREHQSPMMEAVVLRGLGQTFREQGNAARAEPLLRRALAMLETESGTPEHQLAATFTCLGELYLSEDKFGMAEEALLRAASLNEHSLGRDHPQVAIVLEMLGAAAARLKQISQARGDFERARQIGTLRGSSESDTS